MQTVDSKGAEPGRGVKLYAVAAFVAGALAFIPALLAWFTSEELVLFAIVDVDPFALWSGRDRVPGFFRPLIPMLAWVWAALFGVSALAFHVLSVALHLLNSVLVGLVARELVRYLPGDDPVRWRGWPVACGGLFWVWPSHSEAVAWIPGLTDVFAATWVLCSLLAYFAYRNRGDVMLLLAALVGYGAALCTKEASITLPGAIAIYEILRVASQKKLRRENVIGPLLFGMLLAGYFLFRRWLMGVFLGGYGELEHSSFSWQRLHWALAPNLSNAFVPIPGLHLYGRDVLVAVFFAGAAVLLWLSFKQGRAVGPAVAAGAAALVLFLPSINLPCGHITSGQRFAYIPSTMAVIAVVFSMAVLVKSRGRAITLITVLTLASALTLGMYNYNWYRAGKVSEKIIERMGKLPAARKMFVLATTGNYREAYIVPHSLAFAGQALLDKPPSIEMPTATQVKYWSPDVRVRVSAGERDGRAGWLVTLSPDDEGNARKAEEAILEIMAAPGPDWAILRPEPDGVFVSPENYDPAVDKVVYLDGDKWHEL